MGEQAVTIEILPSEEGVLVTVFVARTLKNGPIMPQAPTLATVYYLSEVQGFYGFNGKAVPTQTQIRSDSLQQSLEYGSNLRSNCLLLVTKRVCRVSSGHGDEKRDRV